MYPLDHVEAHIHGVCIRRQHFDLEGVLVAGRLERLVPPAGAIQQGAAHRLRRPRVEVVDNGLDSLADRRRRVPLLQPVARNEPTGQLILERHRVVDIAERPEATLRVKVAGSIARFRQGHEAVVHAHADRPGMGHYIDQEFTGIGPGKGHCRLQFGIARERPDTSVVKPGADRVRLVITLPLLFQLAGNAVAVMQQEIRRIDQHGTTRVAHRDRKSPQHRAGKRLLHRRPLCR